MLVMTLKITIQPEKKSDAVKVFTALCSQAEVMTGCLLCRLYNTIGLTNEDDEIFLIEKWDTKENIKKHILSPSFKQLIEIMDFSTSEPELLFHEISQTLGIEMVEELCRDTANLNDPADFDYLQ